MSRHKNYCWRHRAAVHPMYYRDTEGKMKRWGEQMLCAAGSHVVVIKDDGGFNQSAVDWQATKGAV